MRVEIPFVVLNRRGTPVEGANVTVYKRLDYDSNGNVYGLSSADASGATYTYVTDYAHDLVVGNTVTVTGSSLASYNVSSAVITAIPALNSFTVEGGTSNPGIPAISNGKVVKTPVTPAKLYTTSDVTNFAVITNPLSDAYGRINGWLNEGQYVIVISGLNLSAVQYFEAVAGDSQTDGFTRSGVTLSTNGISFGDKLILSSSNGEVQLSANEGTNGYSTTFDAYYPHAPTSGLMVLASISDPVNLGTTGTVTLTPAQTVTLTSASVASGAPIDGRYDMTYTASAVHSLSVGTTVDISGAANSSYNGVFTINAVTSTTFTVLGPPSTPGTNPSFSSGAALTGDTTGGQAYQVTYSAKVPAQTITSASTTASSTTVTVTTAIAPVKGQGISAIKTSDGSILIAPNEATITAVVLTSGTTYSLTISKAATGTSSGGATVTLSTGILFNSATSVRAVSNYDDSLVSCTLPAFASSSSSTVSSIFGQKNRNMASFSDIASNAAFTNPNFDTNTTGWTATNSTITRDTVVYDSPGSPASLRWDNTGASDPVGFGDTLTGTLTGSFEAGKTYTITWRTKATQLYWHEVYFGNGSDVAFHRIVNKGVENWATVNETSLPTATVTWTPAATVSGATLKFDDRSTFFGGTYGTGMFWFDQFEIRATDTGVERLRLTLNSLVEDLKKYGIIS